MSFTDLLRVWIEAPPPRAQPAQPAQPLAGDDQTAGAAPPCWPDEAAAWGEGARGVFIERLAIADELEMDTAPGSPAWEVALREARRIASGIPDGVPVSRDGDFLDAALGALATQGGLRYLGTLSPQQLRAYAASGSIGEGRP